MEKTEEKEVTEKKEKNEDIYTLLIWNDDINSFQWVIKSLIEICGHSLEQAEQCAFIAHNKGKCDVKKGNKEELLDMKRMLNSRKLEATVEQN